MNGYCWSGWIWLDMIDIDGYGWIWMDVGGNEWIWVDMDGYGWIWEDMGGYGWICVYLFGWIWELWGAVAAEGFAKLRRCSPNLRPQVHPPKKTSCRNLAPCNLQDLNLQDLRLAGWMAG